MRECGLETTEEEEGKKRDGERREREGGEERRHAGEGKEGRR